MNLNLRETARLLQTSERTIYSWVKDKGLPAHRINEQLRFNRSELLEWAVANGTAVAGDLFESADTSEDRISGLAEALEAGGVHYRVSGTDKPSILESVIRVIPFPPETDKTLLLNVFLNRESMGSTGIGNGIAIPHVRNPIVFHASHLMISLCFLEKAIEFDAIDGKPVHTLFTIVSPTIQLHLNCLSRLASALRQPSFADVISRQAPKEEIMKIVRSIDLQAPLSPIKRSA